MEHHAHALREIAESVGLEPVQQIARQPGIKGVYRVTVRFVEGQARNSAATLCRFVVGDTVLAVVYQGMFHHKPLTHPIPSPRYEAFETALQQVGFDRMSDQPNVPFYGADLWLVERAAGSFLKSVICAPRTALNPHVAVVQAVQYYLPEAVRQVQ